ncbi:MAG: PKD domain-containing protein [Bacteroidetes bacterium]|nr:PKD domain-containing protein [Bacteroidota bacterium]
MKTKTLLSILFTSAILPLTSYMAFAQCTAGFTYTINGATVAFTNTCSGNTIPYYSWSFGDGNGNSVANPANTYLYNGSYPVCLYYYGDSLNPPFCSATFCDTLVITNATNPPCNAAFTTYVDQANPIVYFNNNSSYNVSWFWNFGDGNTSTVQNPVHQYSVNSTYSVCLTTITTVGDTCFFCDTINSTPCLQLLNTSYTYTLTSNTATFTSNCSGGTSLSYNWNFGDGNSSNLQNPVHTYQYNGIYYACLTYGDSMVGCAETFCDTVIITTAVNPPCNIYFSHSFDSIPTTQVHFYGYSSIQPTQWYWDFGDGNTSTQQYPTHTFISNGSHTVCLTVVRSYYGDTCTFCDTVNITIPGLLSGSVFSDANANCVKDGGDNPLANWIVKAQETTLLTIFYGVANAAGNYTVTVPAGNYLLTLLPFNTYWNQVCPVSPLTYSVSVAQQATVSNLNFGMQAVVSCADLTVGIGSTNQRRCLTNNYFVVQGANNGTIAASNVLLKVDFDTPLGRIIPLSSTLPWDSISGTEYFWKLGTMISGQSVSFTVTDSVSCAAAQGDTLYAAAFISPTLGDCNLNNNAIEDFKTITGSYDPNEKRAVTTSNKISITQGIVLATDTIDYHIGFQNTGNDTAFTVTVYDTLDSDLNIQSVISGVSTHAYTFELLGANVLKWTFNNILLPDSNINEPLSHGFVKFRLRQKSNNPIGTVIKNSAAIVFDFNLPVITDTVVLTVGTPLNVPEEKGNEDNIITIYPNPSNGVFVVVSEIKLSHIEIYNLLGKMVLNVPANQSTHLPINLSALTDGIYFLQIKTADRVVAQKIIIQR